MHAMHGMVSRADDIFLLIINVFVRRKLYLLQYWAILHTHDFFMKNIF